MHLRIWLLTLLSIAYSCTAQQENTSEKYTNRLVDESSPYLLQHAHNPVDWYPWTDEAFTKAKEDDKLVIVSIGYAACHWCHVMEHESFEDTAVARLMNERFVSVKVDREERPDVDDVYMNACQLTSQRGCGWPLNAICLPNGQPIFVGTYLPKNQWVQVLERLDNLFHANPDKAYDFAAQLTQGIQALQLVEDHDEELQASAELLENFTTNLLTNQDLKRGGRKGAPKFPMPTVYQYLLQYQYYYDNPQALETVLNTLNKMANGGIYDPLGGGFARYSTDDEWKVPHFEKMLYDNGQLVSLYAQVYKLTKNEDYKEIITETLDFVERELTDESGGFYSSLDADSEGEEGKFYIWELNEVEEILGQDSELFAEYYQLEEKGNWEEEKNILLKAEEQDELLTKFDLSSSELSKKINQAERKLFEARSKRIRPGLDDKIITSWNALMLEGYVDAYMAWGEEKYLQRAIKNASFIKKEVLQEDYRLYRIHKAGKSSINGFLDDYAITIRAFTALYQATFDEQWLYDAKGMLEYALKYFEDSSSVFFYYTSDLDDPLISRQRIINDNVIPSSNAYMCQNLLQLGTYFDKQEWLNLAKDMLAQVQPQMNQYPDYHTQWGQALMQIVHQPYEVAIVGDNYQSMLQDIGKQYLPDAWYLGGKDEGTLTLLTSKLVEGQTTIYVCQQKVCKLPVLEVEKALGLIGK